MLESSTRFDAENRSPTPVDDSVRTGRDQPVDIDVRANDSDPDGDALTVDSVTQPQHGSAAIQPDGTVRYTPASGFEGSDSFTYTIGDGRGGTATAEVSVIVAHLHAERHEDRQRARHEHAARNRLRHHVQR